MKPPIPLKWVGGKRKQAPSILQDLGILGPEGELLRPKLALNIPMIGGGGVYFSARAAGWTGTAVLGDRLAPLIAFYKALRTDVDLLLEELQPFADAWARTTAPEATYYGERASWNRRMASLTGRSPEGYTGRDCARFYFLHQTGFNGLYRVNRRGELNVAIGRRPNGGRFPFIVDAQKLRAASKALQRASLHCGPFTHTVKSGARGGAYYFDPPYVPASKTANFTGYSGPFGYAEQKVLASTGLDLVMRGHRVVASNSDVPEIRQLWEGFDIRVVGERRSINSKVNRRGPVPCVRIVGGPLQELS
jgi:DNA adenine methylase